MAFNRRADLTDRNSIEILDANKILSLKDIVNITIEKLPVEKAEAANA